MCGVRVCVRVCVCVRVRACVCVCVHVGGGVYWKPPGARARLGMCASVSVCGCSTVKALLEFYWERARACLQLRDMRLLRTFARVGGRA